MKKISLLFLCTLFSLILSAQRSSLSHQAIIKQNGEWIKMLPDSRVEIDHFFDNFLFELGLDANYHFELRDKSIDDLGISHYKYIQHFNGIPIEGAVYILHSQDGFVTHAGGKLVRGITDIEQMSIYADEALNISKEYMGSEVFYWEIPEMESLLKRIKNDPNATFYPASELVYAASKFNSDHQGFRLAWKHVIHATHPDQKKTIYVDVINGEIINSIEGFHGSNIEGLAKTRYHGTQTIITDSISPTEYRLVDSTRGGGIITLDMNTSTEDYTAAVNFVDEDNYWDNDNAELDNAATDAHWGAEMFYDYMLQEHNLDSYDGKGSALVSYVHYDRNLRNAFWNGSFVTYGDGLGNPFTSIDVVGHEFTHGVTEFSAGLIYQNQSGALNESFSDIFGTALEVFALQDSADWIMGTTNFKLRDMSNPNAYNQPDTYNGLNWYVGSQDNGGVHINSGVQNFWFYLLCEGGNGMNDHGDTYVVDSLGMEVAAAIAYRNLTTYLTPNSTYLDARLGSLQAAEDIYGSCSNEVLQVARAWHAVGIGSATIGPDFQLVEVLSPLISSCDLSTSEQVAMSIRFNPTGCSLQLLAGEMLEVSYQINSDTPVVEIIVLNDTLNEGDIFHHEFKTMADLSTPGQYLIDYKVSFLQDSLTANNEINEHKLTNPYIFDGSKTLAFEKFEATDSIYARNGANATGFRSLRAKNTGRRGYLMQSFGATPNNVTIVPSDEANYAANPEFVSRMCICVDLSEWDEAFLNFDLRQTLSPFYLINFGVDISYMIGMRITIDGQQIGDQFHPLTNDADPFLTHVMDISDYAGTSFTLCFESINFQNDSENPDGNGDKSLLDNVFFSQSDVTKSDDLQLNNVEIYPNPTSGLISIELDKPGIYDIEVIDLLGHIVKDEHMASDNNPITLDLTNLTRGVYLISISSEEFNYVQKVILE